MPAICPKVLIADKRENGSINNLDIASRGKNPFKTTGKLILVWTNITSIMNQIDKNPKAKAERLINNPKNKHKAEKQTKLTK